MATNFAAAPVPATPAATPPGVTPARWASRAFARAYLTTMRPYLLFVSGFTGVLGMAIAPEPPVAPALLLCAVFFLSYGFGQALTDCFQLDTDALSSPYRPLVRGAVHRRDVMAVSLVGLAASGLVLIAFHPLNAVLAPAEIAGLATYTWFKRRWWGGPAYNAWIVAALVVLGYVSACGSTGTPLGWRPELGWALAVAFLGYANFVLAGYFKDVSADRATGYRTFPVVFGPRAAAWASHALALAAAAAVAGLVVGAHSSETEVPARWVVFAAAGALASIAAQVLLHRVRRESDAHRPIALVVHAYLLLTAASIVALRPGWAPALAVAYVLFLAVLRGRPMKEQI